MSIETLVAIAWVGDTLAQQKLAALKSHMTSMKAQDLCRMEMLPIISAEDISIELYNIQK